MMELDHWKILRKIDGTHDKTHIGLINILNTYEKESFFKESFYKDKKGEKRKCYMCTINGVRLILDNIRNYKNKKNLLIWYENHLNKNSKIVLYKRQEEYFIEELETVLHQINIHGESQYHVYKYYVDYYIPAFNIAIEYDEGNHKSYTYENQELRQKKIETKLGCKFIRLTNLNDNLTNIGIVINEILKSRD